MRIDLTQLDVSQSGQLADYGHDIPAWLHDTAIKCDLCGEHFDSPFDGIDDAGDYRWVCEACGPTAREDIAEARAWVRHCASYGPSL